MSKTTQHALTLVASPKFAVAKDEIQKLQATAVAQVAAVGQLETKAAMGGTIAGLTLTRVKHSLPHGKFGAWLDQLAAGGAVKKSQANYYMRLGLVFLEKMRVDLPQLLALPGEQLSLEVGDNHTAKQFLGKLEKFVGDLSLNELLIKHGIKGVGMKLALEQGEDGEAGKLGAAEDYFAEVAQRVYGFRQIVTSRESLQRLSPQQLETLNQTVTDSYSEFRRLYDEAKGKTAAISV